MRKFLASLMSACVLSLGVGFVAAPPAQAAGCATKAEFNKVKKGMTRAKVKKIFGTGGSQFSVFSKYESREYKTCSPYKYGYVMITFKSGKVSDRSALWF